MLVLVLLPTVGIAAALGSDYAVTTPSSSRSLTAAWAALVGYALVWSLAIASAVSTMRTPPGHIPLWLYSREPGDQAYFHNVLQAVEKKLDGSLRFCRKCGAFKPDLAHHSRELGLCILCYQHWDIWSNNAIGFYNHKAYVLTLLYGVLGHGLSLALLLPGVIRMWPLASAESLPPQLVLVHALWHGGDSAVLGYAVLSVTASALLGGGCLAWLCFHGFLMARGTTAHGFFRQVGCARHKPPKPKLTGRPFDFGLKGNFTRACGRFPLLWCLPTNQGVEGNGIFFEVMQLDGRGADGGDSAWGGAYSKQ